MSQPEMRRIEENWILITYDIPAVEGKLRKKVLRSLRKLGALQFTESVYYLPFTSLGMNTARDICSGNGYAFTWYSKLPIEDAKELTTRYVHDLTLAIEDLETKVWKVENLLRTGAHPKKVVWRIKELNTRYRALVKAVELAGVEALSERLFEVRQRIDALKRRLEE